MAVRTNFIKVKDVEEFTKTQKRGFMTIKEIKGYEQIIDGIELIRSRNNKNWMNLLRIALKHAPKEGQKIMRNIVDCDSEINKLTSRLAGGNKK
jgi:hypothetical protein